MHRVFFRASFTDALTLKDEIIRGLRQLDQAQNAATETEFDERLKTGLRTIESWAEPEPLLTISFWPQPVREIDIVSLEQHLDSRFATMCAHGLAEMREGYEPITRRDHTGLKSDDTSIYYFEDGLLVIKTRPVVEKEGGFFTSMFVPLSLVTSVAAAASELFEGSGTWCQIALSGMQGKNFEEYPDSNPTSVSMGMFSDDHAVLNQCLIPFTSQAYQHWVAKVVKRFGRIFTER